MKNNNSDKVKYILNPDCQEFDTRHIKKQIYLEPRVRMAQSTLDMLKAQDPQGFINQMENIAQKQRCGLFTQPPNHLGDIYREPKPPQGPKQVQVNPHLMQKVGPELFSRLHSTNLGDPYKDSFRAKQLYEKQKHDMAAHGPFKPSHNKKLMLPNFISKHSQFQHFPQYDKKEYKTRGPNGEVLCGKKNFYTNNPKKGKGDTTNGHLFSRCPYMGSPYDAPKQKDTVPFYYQNQLAQHKAKMINGPFKNTVKGQDKFTPDLQVYHKDPQAPQQPMGKIPAKGPFPPWRYNNPPKKGYNRTLQPFPKYIEQGERRKGMKKSDCEQDMWIPNFNGTTKPSTVPSQMLLNVKKFQNPH